VTKTPQCTNVIARRKPAAAVRTAYLLTEREEIFRRFSVQRPEPRGELEHTNPLKSARVALLTPKSVACAERATATTSVKGL
ncbi:endonuclease III, partial [Rhizobium leguminosarum]